MTTPGVAWALSFPRRDAAALPSRARPYPQAPAPRQASSPSPTDEDITRRARTRTAPRPPHRGRARRTATANSRGVAGRGGARWRREAARRGGAPPKCRRVAISRLTGFRARGVSIARLVRRAGFDDATTRAVVVSASRRKSRRSRARKRVSRPSVRPWKPGVRCKHERAPHRFHHAQLRSRRALRRRVARGHAPAGGREQPRPGRTARPPWRSRSAGDHRLGVRVVHVLCL